MQANIRATARRYRKVCRTQITLAFSLRHNFLFFQQWLCHLISREYGKQRAQIIRRTLAIIQSGSTTQGPPLMLDHSLYMNNDAHVRLCNLVLSSSKGKEGFRLSLQHAHFFPLKRGQKSATMLKCRCCRRR